MTEPRPHASDGEAPRRPVPPARPRSPHSPRPPGPTNHAGVSLPPEPIDLLLGKVRDRDVVGRPRVGPDAGPGGPRARVDDEASATSSDDPEWTFRPDDTPAPTWPYAAYDPELGPDATPTHRARIAPRVGVVVIVVALFAGLLAVTHIGPFHSSAPAAATPPSAGAPKDIRGVWNALNAYQGVLYSATMHITHENLSSGKFSGTITSPVGPETMKGTVTGTTMTFTINLGSGTEKGTAGVSKTGTKVKIQGTFTNPRGGQGTIIATRTST